MVKTTLLISVLNGEELLGRAFQSVYSQTVKVDEIIVIDDASSDSTSQVIQEWSKKLPMKIISNEVNLGLYPSIYLGVLESKGDLIFRLDHDDEWLPNHVKDILNVYSEDSKIVLYATSTINIDISTDKKTKSATLSNSNIRKKLLWDNPIVHSSTAFIKKDYLKVYRPSDIKSSADYSLWLELLNIGDLKFCEEVSVIYYIRKASLSRKNIKQNLYDRFILQIRAIQLFFYLYPLRSCLIAFILSIRFILLPLTKKSKSNKVIIPIYGGMGNQMFQFAYSINLKLLCEYEPIYLDLTSDFGRVKRSWSLDCFGIQPYQFKPIVKQILIFRMLISSKLEKINKNFNLNVHKEISANNLKGRILKRRIIKILFPKPLITGFWQSESYFKESNKLIKSLFTFPVTENLAPLSTGRNNVSVHIRLGDYINDPIAKNYHHTCTIDWYLSAIQYLREKLDNPYFIVFSDEANKLSDYFCDKSDIKLITNKNNKPDWTDMALMSQADHFIISNSSYSWWASFLGEKSDSIVIAPKFWNPNILTKTLPIYRKNWVLK